MTMLLESAPETVAAPNDGDGPWHIFCCRPNVAFCGLYREGPLVVGVDGPDCGDCLDAPPCPVCGCGPEEECDLCEAGTVL